MDELVKEFLVESHENLDRLDRELLILEENPQSTQSIASIFRTLHTIKGTCGFLGFAKLEAVAHAGENLLSRLRDNELQLTADITTALLQTVDAIRAMLSIIESHGNDGVEEYGALVQVLQRLQQGAPVPELRATRSDVPVVAAHEPAVPVVVTPVAIPEPPAERATSTGMEVVDTARAHGVSDAYVRVDVGLLDKLMNLVGELVLARNQILQFVPDMEDQVFSATTQRLNLITTELQSGVMKTRMQPIGNVWDKVPRLVRDLCHALGKQVRVEMEGKETELDKTIIEAIKDPLTHLVRNCVDHGVEAPDVRAAAGKRAEGRLFLRAFHEGGQVIIEISDDGAGLNAERIRAKAVEKGLISPEQASRMGERDVHNLIFLPGFSTAQKVSNVSGRGVGMDVVKTNIEKIGGVVDLQSRQGQGTTFRIKIPLTLAIIPALIVSTGGDRYAIPQISLLELVRLDGEQARDGVEHVHGTPVYRLRGNLLPLVDLSRELGLEARLQRAAAEGTAVNIVVLQADERRFGLVVDQINDTEEIVVKPLGKHLKGIAAFAGATIMGDGRVALILDVLGLAQRANVVGQGHHGHAVSHDIAARAGEISARSTLLLFATADARRMAIPLSMVARLEVFARRQLESVGNHHVVQYRGEVLPLVSVESLLGVGGYGERDDAGAVHVVVHKVGESSVGLIVGRIVDIVDEQIELKPVSEDRRAAGISGCAVIQQKVTELVDVGALLQTSCPGLLRAQEEDGTMRASR